MLTNYRRRSRAGAVTPYRGRVVAGAAMRTARTLVEAAKKLAPYARAAGAKSTIQRKLGGFRVKPSSYRVKPKAIASSASVGDEYSAGNDYVKAPKVVIGRVKKNTPRFLRKMVEASMQKNVYRFQGLTNFDTNTGFFVLGNIRNTAGDTIYMPLHIYDLTCVPNVSSPEVGQYYYWNGLTALAQAQRAPLPGQNSSGASTTTWTKENSSTSGATFPNSRLFRHDWTSIKMLIYGARKRTTKFEIIFFRCMDEFSNPMIANTTNASYNELIEYLQRPCIYSPLQSYNPNPAKKIRIVKRCVYYVNASQTTDVDTTVGKTKEVNIFLRHGKVYNLDWRHEGTAGTLPHEVADGVDYLQDLSHHNTPWHSSRLYMAVRALAPERRTSDTATPDANVDPTYDIVIRNQVSFPS